MKLCSFGLIVAIIVAQPLQAWGSQSAPDAPARDAKSPPGDSAPAGQAQAGQLAPWAIRAQAWQVRRTEFAGAVRAANANGKDADAHRAVDRILTDYEHNPNGRTPMEVMDILGMFYLPKDGVKKTMPVIVREAVLGWFDVLQWASESGRAEIVNNEKFLVRAFLIAGGKKGADEWGALIKNEPQEAKRIVEEGIRYAAQPGVADGGYDHRWPTAYGLERTVTALKGESGEPSAAIPRMDHDEAMAEAAKKISAYYLPGVQ
jgi:hypothetical protein